MMIFLLFVILVVLLYAVGLLPRVIKAISGLFALILLTYTAAVYGWLVVAGIFIGAVSLAIFGAWMTYLVYGWNRRFSAKRDEAQRQQTMRDAEEKEKKKQKDREFEKQRIIQAQIDSTNSIGKD